MRTSIPPNSESDTKIAILASLGEVVGGLEQTGQAMLFLMALKYEITLGQTTETAGL